METHDFFVCFLYYVIENISEKIACIGMKIGI